MRQMLAFMMGAMMGGLVGATVTLLMTPSSGNEMRGQLQDRFLRLRTEIRRAADDRRLEMEQQLAALRAPQRPID